MGRETATGFPPDTVAGTAKPVFVFSLNAGSVP